MKAFLLAAGLGTRLRPITDTTPKCLIPIDGRPMVDIWMDAFAEIGVEEVLINLHHLAPLVRAHLDDAALGRPGRAEDGERGDRATLPMRLDEYAEIEIGEVVGVDDEEHLLVDDEVAVREEGARAA